MNNNSGLNFESINLEEFNNDITDNQDTKNADVRETVDINEAVDSGKTVDIKEAVDIGKAIDNKESIDFGKGDDIKKSVDVEDSGKAKTGSLLQNSLSNTIVNFMFIVLLIFGLSTLLISYFKNKKTIDDYYIDASERLTGMLALSQNGDYIDDLAEIVESEEFQSIRKQAFEEDNMELITDYLKDRKLYDEYISTYNRLRQLRSDELDIEQINIYIRNGDSFTYILSDSGDVGITGRILDVSESDTYSNDDFYDNGEVLTDTGNTHIDSFIERKSVDEAYSYGFYPIYNSEGKAVATLNLVLNMNDVYKDQDNYLIVMIIVITFLTAIIAVVGIIWLRNNAVIPIEQITRSVLRFENNGEGYLKDNITEYDIHTGNEIEELYKCVNSMQNHMVDYVDNLKEVTAKQERIDVEVSIATKIQLGMLEKIEPNYVDKKEYDMYATMTPAQEVGGDFYDFFMVDDDHLAILIADVSDKGVGSAFMMAIAKTIIKTYGQLGQSPSEILKGADRRISVKNYAALFVTVWLGIIDLNTGHVVSCNAGHDYPFIMHEDEGFVLTKDVHGPPIAFVPDMEFPEVEFDLRPGDRIFLYTDGLNEAKRKDGGRFGVQRIKEVLDSHKEDDNKTTLLAMKQAVDEFVGNEPQFDDMTMLGFTYKGRN